MWRLVIFAAMLLGGVAYSRQRDYEGDGQLLDRGASVAIDRYVLDLGEVKRGGSEYEIRNLPRTEFAVGFLVSGLPPEQAQKEAARAGETIEMSLNTMSGAVVFSSAAPLGDCVWGCAVGGCSDAFGYRRAEGNLPGTYFTPRRGSSFRLRVVLPKSKNVWTQHKVHIVARGGGWK